MAYDYPPEKLNMYLYEDAGSDLTYYALVEASQFARHWITILQEKLYKELESRINVSVKLGQIPEEIRSSIKGLSQWKSYVSRRDHDTLIQV
uniref:Uncharacterized protein n=1 Tax=Cucumis melo TaxID=3656 RepID=A0A9I9E5D3_CUCME